MQIILSLFFSLLFAVLSAYLAAKKQRHASLWFLIGLLGGLFGLLILLFLPAGKTPIEGDFLNDFIQKKAPKAPLLIDNHPWYYVDTNRTSVGPLTPADLTQLYQTGLINDDTLVWHEGLASWQKLKDSRK